MFRKFKAISYRRGLSAAIAGEILNGKKAYVEGSLVTGNITTQTLANTSITVGAGYYPDLRNSRDIRAAKPVNTRGHVKRSARKSTVDKRGAKGDEVYVRDVLGDMANATNVTVVNDEAHHAWRIPAESKIKGVKKEDIFRLYYQIKD
ncbi:MAG: hypothetical protein HW390_766 [Candidatus Brocadiaceae bacterium]|nr:hypothetical protein [Candidatus Brocadiaceae bacterium]